LLTNDSPGHCDDIRRWNQPHFTDGLQRGS
jgi:hypothetical protein